MLFGTYENPCELTSTCGFDHAREQPLAAMRVFRDVDRAENPVTDRTAGG